jgi:hypothetical protein
MPDAPAASAPAAATTPPAASDGASTAADQKALLATFEDLAVSHASPVRSFMLEVRWGEAQASWIELARPVLKSLRAMASQVGHDALTSAIDGFDTALGKAGELGASASVTGPARDTLLTAYAPLARCLPTAFELDGERDRREPLLVRALLGQIAELDPLQLQKLLAAGLGRLDALVHATAEEVAVVAGIPDDVASAVAERVQAFRRATPSALSTLDPASTARELDNLVDALGTEHRAFDSVSRGWSEADRSAKKRVRRQREVAYLAVLVTLARLGEIDFALRLEKLPFARRLEELERLVSRAAPARAPKAMETAVQPGASAAP